MVGPGQHPQVPVHLGKQVASLRAEVHSVPATLSTRWGEKRRTAKATVIWEDFFEPLPPIDQKFLDTQLAPPERDARSKTNTGGARESLHGRLPAGRARRKTHDKSQCTDARPDVCTSVLLHDQTCAQGRRHALAVHARVPACTYVLAGVFTRVCL